MDTPASDLLELARLCAQATKGPQLLAAAADTLTRIAGRSANELLGGTAEPPNPETEVALAMLDAALTRLDLEENLRDLTLRVDNAQSLANMGDYDWHIATDTNRWSDQLFRIYGHEPQAFSPTYDKFVSFLHPDDRDKITAIHQHSYATGEPYEMIERIVRPTGEVRYLSSNGQVVTDQEGTPVRMRGTCIDITDRVLAEEERERVAAQVQEHQMRRQQALEINDNVVQGLTAALYALEMDETEASASYLRRTLNSARHMITDLVSPLTGDELHAGDLVRTTASSLRTDGTPPQA
ncbi:PAS domain-containing protein [Nocardioides luti]|nr:PAS domain-containing protein [Nocardioides luti]